MSSTVVQTMYPQSRLFKQHIVSSGFQLLLPNGVLFHFKSKNEFILEVCKVFALWKKKLFCIGQNQTSKHSNIQKQMQVS